MADSPNPSDQNHGASHEYAEETLSSLLAESPELWEVVQRFAAKLRALGCLGEDSRVIANHFSHNGHALHTDLEEIHGPAGIEVGHDGMTL